MKEKQLFKRMGKIAVSFLLIASLILPSSIYGSEIPEDVSEANVAVGVEEPSDTVGEMEEPQMEEPEAEEFEAEESEAEESETEEAETEESDDEETLEKRKRSKRTHRNRKNYVIMARKQQDINEIQQEHATVVEETQLEELVQDDTIVVELTGSEADEIDMNPDVIVEEDFIFKGSTEEETATIENVDQWNLNSMNVVEDTEATDVIKIAIIDSGIDYSDSVYVEESISLTPDEINCHNPLFTDSNGHGTAMAGIIAANGQNGVLGVNPNAIIYSVKVLDEDNRAPLSRIVDGIYWAIEKQVDIINLSFGSNTFSEILQQTVKDAEDAGIMVVASSGNNSHTQVQYPAAYDEVIAVGSINPEGEVAEHTSVGEELELLAPGEHILTNGLYSGVIGTSGTSIAAAQVTGLVSLIKARDNTKSNGFVRELVKASAKPVEVDEDIVAGVVDHGFALEIYDEFARVYTECDDVDLA